MAWEMAKDRWLFFSKWQRHGMAEPHFLSLGTTSTMDFQIRHTLAPIPHLNLAFAPIWWARRIPLANISSLIRLTFIQNESLQALHPLVHALKFHPSKAPRLLGRRRAHVHVGHQLMRPRQAFLNLRGQVTTNHQILVVDGGWVLAGRFESVSCARGLFMMTDQSTKERGHAKKGATPYLNTLWCEWSERTPRSFPRPHLGATPAATGSSSQQVLCSALLHAQLRSQSKNEAGKHHDSANRSMNQSMYQR